MLPLQQAYESKHSIIEYLRSTFNFKDRQVQIAFDKFIEDPQRGLFKGPYISLRLPFIQAKDHQDIPLDIKPDMKPYMHQLQAFARLTSKDGHKPLSTLVSTGTSSGKTECFLYPVLDYCHREMSRPGIKVIILYPMNALATDQAKRLADTIWNDERLKGKLRAGLFIGEGKGGRKFPSEMGPDHVVENRDEIVNNPPDILLTNFKMLDYGLMKGRFHRLWYHNLKDTGILRYIVLDELHTYDGAQGTDVANLIRRLKLKLEIPDQQLCAVGTSATMGRGPDAVEQLTAYASKVSVSHSVLNR
jgi:DEAD/DEAH box helicase domain-containing protein